MDDKTKKRRKNVKKDILNYLINKGEKGATNIELSQIGIRYGAYIGEFYREGHVITTENLGDGIYRYKHKSSPKEKVVREKALDKLIAKIDERSMVDSEELIEILKESSIEVRFKANTYLKDNQSFSQREHVE